MKQTKQFLRPLLMAIVMMVGMLVPQGAWAQELWVEDETTISSDESYENIEVHPGGVLIINEGVTLTVTSGLNIHDIYQDGNVTVINYGTIIGEGQINMQGGVLANHGHIDLGGSSSNGTYTFYNTGTLGENINLTPTEECNHAYYDELGPVDATCTHGAGTQYRCNTCYYIGIDETGEPKPHDNHDHNGLMVCSTCGQLTFDAPTVGEGTAESPYQIANAGNLFWFADKVNNDYENFKEANAVLTADIVVNDGTFAADGTFTATGASEPSTPIEWLIIARFVTYSHGYTGTFDGQGHTISGLYANYDCSGLVGMSSGESKIKNVGVTNSYFSGHFVGGICGNAGNNTEISNCYSSNVICKGNYVGGILGLVTNTGVSIVNCYSTASLIGVEDWAEVGGITAQSCSTTNCYTTYGNATGWSESEINCEANVSLERFASGEIAYKLNGSVDGEGNWTAGATDGTQKWYQKLGENGDSYPVLAAAEGNTVYEQKTIDCGGTVVACNYYNTEEEDVTQPHNYQVLLDENSNPVFVWSVDYTTATLQVVCLHNAEHTANVEVTGEGITSAVTTPATCTATGVRTYTATATYEGEEYTGTKEVEISIDPDAHDYRVQLDENSNPVFVWSVDYTTATLQVVCSHNAEHTANVEVTGEGITSAVTTPATCTTAGVRIYTATATYEGDTYTGTKEVEIAALGHSFDEETDPDHTHCTACDHWWTYYTTTGEDIAGIEEKVGAVAHYFKEGNGYFETEECFTSVPEDAFNQCETLKSISLPFATEIQSGAFSDCRELTEVKAPEAITVGEDAFSTDLALTSIYLPKATTIGGWAFEGCAMTSLALPAVTSIGSQALKECPNLTDLTLPCNFDLDRESVGLGENESVTISRVHKGESVIIEGVLATCTEDGYEAYEGCSVCLEPFGEKTVIPALGHKYYNGVCSVCGYVCQHDYERGEGNEGDNFHVCTICQYVDDCTFEDGICTGCGYVCEHKTGGYENEHTHRCSACKLSLPHIIDEEHLYYSVYTEDGDCVYTYTGTSREILVQNYDELESLKFKVYSLCNVCSIGDPNYKVYPEDFFAKAYYNDIDCSDKASLDVIIYKRVDDEAYEVAYYELKVSISNPSHKWENGVCSRCDAECVHDFSNKTLTDEPVADGLYAYACDRGCGAHSDDHIVKGDSNGNIFALTATTDGETTTYTATDVTIEDGKAFASPVDFTVTNLEFKREFSTEKGMYTVMVPFGMSVDQAADFGKFYTVSGFDPATETVTLAEVTVGTAAHTAYIFKPKSTKSSHTFDQALVKATVGASLPDFATLTSASATGLYGTYQSIPAPEGSYGYSAGDGSNAETSGAINAGSFVKVGTGVTLPAYRAVLWVTGVSGASASPARLNVDLGDMENGLGHVGIDAEPLGLCFDLNGRPVSEPRRGEVFIMNGRKFVIK